MSLNVSVLVLLVAGPWSSLGCGAARRAPWSTDLRRSCYSTVEGQPVHSTLVSMQTLGTEQLVGMTELGTGERLVEEATIDPTGRLVEAAATLSPARGVGAPVTATRVVFHPGRNSVEISAPALQVKWSVPSDLPWIWAPMLTGPAASLNSPGRPIATPLGARAAFRAAQSGGAVRLLDLGVLQHHTVTADQLVVPDGADATVILADDVVAIENGAPRRLYLSALDTTLEVLDARAPSSALAAVRCTELSGSIAP
ncbi:MAG TPA: hypothetical protein VFH68_25080 [Polyangia bacterium]|nr:hypothetical protein [Polyangia bacterium]